MGILQKNFIIHRNEGGITKKNMFSLLRKAFKSNMAANNSKHTDTKYLTEHTLKCYNFFNIEY